MEQSIAMTTDFEKLRAMTDDDIDCSDIPALTDEELDSAEWFISTPERELLHFSLDRSVVDFFRKQGRDYRERINSVLRDYVAANA
ncbi:MAG: BrnA antitoxin family protein [Synergistaceae bacterium]|nr:BrnA antitoxin family protein [Synergistaceae bacterium]